MHVCDLVQLAAVVTTHGRTFAESAPQVSSTALEEYWVASRCRLDRWSRTLKAFTTAVHHSRRDALALWPTVRPVIEEILLSEMLTRAWGAVLYSFDRRRATTEGDPVARSVMMGHLEARHRALALLLHGSGVSTVEAVDLNRLRKRVERWIDLLVAQILTGEDLAAFAIQPERAQDFADRHRQAPQAHSRLSWQLTMSSLMAGFRSHRASSTANGDVNRRIAGAVVSCFPAELFDATGVLQSLWLTRLTHGTRDAQGMIDELIRMDEASVLVASRPKRF